MRVNRGYRFKLDPTPAQKARFAHFAGVCRLVYNLALEQRRDFHRQFRASTGKRISFASQCRELTALRASFEWIADVSQTCQQQVLRDLDQAYQRFFDGISGYPTPRKKGINEAFRFQAREVTFRRLNRSWGVVRLPKIGEVRFRWTREVAGLVKNVTVSLDPLGWHVSFATESKAEIDRRDLPAIGVDRGVARALAFSDGRFADMPRDSLERLKLKARHHAQAISRARCGSKRRQAAKRRLAAAKARAGRIRRHFNHVQSHRLAQSFSVVCIEALRTKSMTATARGSTAEPGSQVRQKAGLNRSILEVGWHQFEQFLTYKLVAAGGELRKVDPRHTSTTCSRCGVNDKQHRKSQAVYECDDCGMALNADTNAALNILWAGTRPALTRGTGPWLEEARISSAASRSGRQEIPPRNGWEDVNAAEAEKTMSRAALSPKKEQSA
jgi:putative transposase